MRETVISLVCSATKPIKLIITALKCIGSVNFVCSAFKIHTNFDNRFRASNSLSHFSRWHYFILLNIFFSFLVLHEIAPCVQRVWNWETEQKERKKLIKNMVGIVTRQNKLENEASLLWARMQIPYLFTQFQIVYSVYVRSRSVSEKFFAQFRTSKTRNYIHTQLDCVRVSSVFFSLTHRYLLYIRHSNFSHTHTQSVSFYMWFAIFFFHQIHQTNSANKFVFPVRLFVTFKWMLKQKRHHACERLRVCVCDSKIVRN